MYSHIVAPIAEELKGKALSGASAECAVANSAECYAALFAFISKAMGMGATYHTPLSVTC